MQAKLTDAAAKAEIKQLLRQFRKKLPNQQPCLLHQHQCCLREQRERLAKPLRYDDQDYKCRFQRNSTVNGSLLLLQTHLATGETKVYIGSGTDTVYNVPIYYKLTVKTMERNSHLSIIFHMIIQQPRQSRNIQNRI